MQDSEGSLRQIPAINYPAELPVVERREEIARAISEHQVVIIAGETGSGKTTQIPKICLELGRGRKQIIGHTQPRRLAARTVAQRIADELRTPLGETVGYQIRFTDKASDNTAVKLMTDGILLADIQRDRLLRKYDTIIIDEAHERSLNIDFLLGYLKRILPRRPDLKLIITSATIDLESFSRHFDDAPIVEVSGRTYPVETVYLQHETADESQPERSTEQQIVSVVSAIDAGEYGTRGDILVFLPGERDIRELAKALRRWEGAHSGRIEVLPLYARLSRAEQDKVFNTASRGGLRVVLATNVAETSLTVPGIRYVIDPGQARISRYSFRTKIQRLPIEPISQASANQRQGRCGRIAKGVCIRLYSEEDFAGRPEFTDPEIRRTNLAAVILQMLTLRIGAVEDFPFLDPPDTRMVRDGYKLLQELGAVSAAGEITALGRKMARMPVDPRLARMVLAGMEYGCLEEVLVVTSAMSIQDPRERPADKQQQSDQSHARFRHERSDFIAWVNLWRYYEEQRQSLSQNQLRKLCQREFLSFMRMREWRDVHHQLTIACRQMELKPRPVLPEEENYQGLHSALLSGLLGNMAQLHEGSEYLGSRNRKLQIFPGSSQFKKKPKWLVAGEIVETTRVYARMVAAIDPLWALEINPDLLKLHYYQPRWQPRSGRVMAYERVTLYGLTIADKRSVHYGPISPVESRELLIREGLIAGRYRQEPGFLKHNLRLLLQLEDLESRTRRRDIVADEEVLFRFYDERLPEQAYTAGRLQNWLKRNADAAKGLQLTRADLLARDPGSDLEEQYPDHLMWEDMRFPLSYQFEPGGVSDGVSVTVPVALLNRVPRYLFDWLVPGMLREKCISLLKGLPKDLRKKLVPAPDFVDRALAQMQAGNDDLLALLASTLGRLGGVALTASDWNREKLDAYYRMNVRVVDGEGKLLEQSRDLPALVKKLRKDTRATVSRSTTNSPARVGLKRWDFGDLAPEWRFSQAGVDIVSYPALTVDGDDLAIILADYPGEALTFHRLGVLRLLRLHSAQQIKYLRKQLLKGNEFNLVLAGAGLNRAVLVDDLIDGAYCHVMELSKELPYNQKSFEALLSAGSGAVVGVANELEAILLNTLRVVTQVRQLLAGLETGRWADTRTDIEGQLGQLLSGEFQRDTPMEWLAQYPRYIKAQRTRLERLRGQYPKDQQYTAILQALAEPLLKACAERNSLLLECPQAMSYRWLLEEFRVSLFAQNLGTKQAVSQKRLAELWVSVEQWLKENPH